MIEVTDPFDLPATPEALRHQAQHGLLNRATLRRAFQITGHTPAAHAWARFFDVALLVLGAGMLTSGVFFFFAFNWADLHRFAKLGVLEAAVAGAAALAFWLGLQRLSGKVSLTVAALLVGALLAVYGQIYQTGADSYQLFLTWAMLIGGWVLISRFTPLWMIWLGLVNLALCLYWSQMIGDLDGRLYSALFLLNGSALAAWEWAHHRGVTWLEHRSAAHLLAALTLTPLTIATYLALATDQAADDPWLIMASLIFIAVSGGMLYFYSRRHFDSLMLILAALAICLCINSWLIRLIDDYALAMVGVGLLVVVQTASIISWIRNRALLWEVRNT